MYPWYRDSVAAAAAAGLGGPVGVVGSGFCSTGPGQGATTIKTESGYSDCMLALDYVQSKVSEAFSSVSLRTLERETRDVNTGGCRVRAIDSEGHGESASRRLGLAKRKAHLA